MVEVVFLSDSKKNVMLSGDSEASIGTVISSFDGPSPSSLDFVVTSDLVHKNQFVELDYSEGTLIARVDDVIKTNRYFERAESVKEFESSGKKLFDSFPTSEWEYLVAKTKPLGVFAKDSSLIKRPSFPPSPGTPVRLANPFNLKKFLGFNEGDIHLGSLEFHDVPVTLSLDRLLKKHLAILAMSGAGKSYCVSVLFEELLSRSKEQGRLAVVVLDVHGEYSCFAEPLSANEKNSADFSSVSRLIDASDIKFGVSKLSVGDFASLLELSYTQKRELDIVLKSLSDDMRSGLGPYDLNAVLDRLSSSSIKENVLNPLLASVSSLKETRLFDKFDVPSIFDLVKPGQFTIIDLNSITDQRTKQIIASFFAKKMFSLRRQKKIPPFLLVLEEAHNFIPEKTSKFNSISKPIMQTIAREGRKFGASLCLISQRPTHIDTTTLSQCNTNIILRVTNPLDLQRIEESSEGIDRRSRDSISVLKVGEALIVGEAVNVPTFIKVRERKSKKSKHEISLLDSAKLFEEEQDLKNKDVENFL